MIYDLIIYTPMYISAFWTVMLLSAKISENRSRLMLGLFMLTAFSLYLMHALFFQHELYHYVKLESLYFFSSLSVYPLFYWYIKLLTSESEIKFKNFYLLAPAVFFSLAVLILELIMTKNESLTYFNKILLERSAPGLLPKLPKIRSYFYYTSRLVFSVQVILVLIYGRKLVIHYNRRIANFYSSPENRTINWVKVLLSSFVVTSVMSIVFNTIGRSVFVDSAILFIPSLIFSALLFIIGYQGYLQKYTIAELEKDETTAVSETIKEGNLGHLKSKLLALFVNEKIYKDPNLRITEVSAKLNTNRTYVSGIINNEFNLSFNDFVSQYRVNEAKELLRNNAHGKYSLQYISDTAGFGSLNTFIRIFKKVEGITPGKYRHEKTLAG